MYSYLALGDSYTIGEQVLITESFPYQAVQLLRKQAIHMYAPEIIAKTGYTTDELLGLLGAYTALSTYDFVSLLIGVNNQYRGRSVEDFAPEFDELLQQAIAFTGNNSTHVFVLSIPDWGLTPFAEGRDAATIAKEIDAYNAYCSKAALAKGCHFINITTAQRNDVAKEGFLAEDKLHPSGQEYAKWADKLTGRIMQELAR